MKFEEWQTLTLDNLYEFGSGLSKSRKDFGFGYPFLTFKEVFHNIFLPQTLNELVNSTEKEQVKCSIKKGDVFLTRTSEKLEELGMSSVALKNYDNATFNGFTKRLRPKQGTKDILIPEYVAFYFRSPKFRNQINSMATMTTRASLNNSMLQRLTIDIPPIDIQRQIIQILNSILQKEELNLKIITTIEELAQTLFKRWFVDFEFPNEEGKPYKSSGGNVVESELGMIPEGWSVDNFEKIITIGSGKRPKSKVDIQDENNQIPIIGASKVMGFTETELFDESIIVIGRVGTHGVVQRLNVPCWPSDNTFVLRSKYEEFMYHKLKTIDYKSMNRGSTQPLLTQKDIKNVKVILPSNELLMEFEDTHKKFSSKISQLKEENTKLENLRDTLLPKLLSGELELPDDMEVTDDVPVS